MDGKKCVTMKKMNSHSHTDTHTQSTKVVGFMLSCLSLEQYTSLFWFFRVSNPPRFHTPFPHVSKSSVTHVFHPRFQTSISRHSFPHVSKFMLLHTPSLSSHPHTLTQLTQLTPSLSSPSHTLTPSLSSHPHTLTQLTSGSISTRQASNLM